MSLHLKWLKVYFYATPIHSLRMVAAWQRAGATQNNILWNMQECILISFEGSIRFSLVTAKTRLADGKHQSHCQDDMSLQLA